MSNSRDSLPKRKSAKLKKPRPDFPLFPHQGSGYWAKKVRQKMHYFGKVADDPKGVKALALWLEQKDELLAGRTPRSKSDAPTVMDLCNRFLTAKRRLLDTDELSPRTFHDYRGTTDRLIDLWKHRLVDDLASEDFAVLRADIAKKRGPVALGNEIGRVRVVFNFAFDSGLIEKPVRFGPTFAKPSRKTLRKERQRRPAKMFSPAELKTLIRHADTQMRAMILLACNGGFGNADIGTLPLSAVDLETGWITFPRQKTAIDRRTPLWKATVTGLRKWLAIRPDHESDLVFITKYGGAWFKEGDHEKARSANPISAEFRKLCKAHHLHQSGRSFYAIRHVFQTVGEEQSETATRHLMGHVDDSMSANYREHIADARLIAVVEHVRRWLFGKAVQG